MLQSSNNIEATVIWNLECLTYTSYIVGTFFQKNDTVHSTDIYIELVYVIKCFNDISDICHITLTFLFRQLLQKMSKFHSPDSYL